MLEHGGCSVPADLICPHLAPDLPSSAPVCPGLAVDVLAICRVCPSLGEGSGAESDRKRMGDMEDFFALEHCLAGVGGGVCEVEDGEFLAGRVEEPVGRDLVSFVEGSFENHVGGSRAGG